MDRRELFKSIIGAAGAVAVVNAGPKSVAEAAAIPPASVPKLSIPQGGTTIYPAYNPNMTPMLQWSGMVTGYCPTFTATNGCGPIYFSSGEYKR